MLSKASIVVVVTPGEVPAASPRAETIIPNVLIAQVRSVFPQFLTDWSALPAELKPMLRQRD